MLTADLDAGGLFLAKIQALRVEQARADALAKLLHALTVKPSLAKDVEAVTGFAEDTKTEFDTRICEALAKDGSEAAKAALAARSCGA